MTNSPPFVLSRASEDDLEEIISLQYECFPQLLREIFMGTKTRDDLPKLLKLSLEEVQQQPEDIWIKVVERSSGKIIAASNWKVYANGPSRNSTGAPTWLEGELAQTSSSVYEEFGRERLKALPGPHVCKYLPGQIWIG
jgi:hypothetical protein